MRHSQTAVLERNLTVIEDFTTEPYEAGWASEARWFVQVLRADGPGAIDFRSEISPDGLTWCAWDGETHSATTVGLVTWPMREFGQWLRLRASVRAPGTAVKVRIYLAVKS